MIETEKTKAGYVYAFIEFTVVNKKGLRDKDGLYIYLEEFYIHPKHRYQGVFHRLGKRLMKRYAQTKFAYFKREKYKGRTRIYTKKQWLRLVKNKGI